MFKKRTILLCALLGAITLALYWPARSFAFVQFDDNGYITNNPRVTGGLTWQGIGWAFQTFYGANWHPLTWISHMLDCQIYGLNAGGHHFTNVLFHTINAILLFIVLLRMTGREWQSFVVAALFAWHPAHVESVAWVAERKDVLSTFFGFLTLLAYTSYVRAPKNKNPSTIYYMVALFCFLLSLLSKPMLVTMPFVLLLLDFWPFRRLQWAASSEVVGATASGSAISNATELAGVQPLPIRTLLMEKLPFFVLMFVSCLMTIWSQDSDDAIMANATVPLSGRVGHAMISYVKYVSMMFWPTKLAFYYPYFSTILVVHAVVALVVILAISKASLQWFKDAPYFPMGWFWFLGTLVPVIGIIQVGGQAMADRYTYFPFIGLFIAVVWGAAQFWERWRLGRFVLTGMTVVVLAACLVLTSIQLQYWRNSITLGQHALKVTKLNYVADCIISEELERDGKYAEAIPYAKDAISIKYNYYPGQLFLGLASLETGKLDDAVTALTEAQKQQPDSLIVYQKLGQARMLQGNLDDAFGQFMMAAKINPADFVSAGQMASICVQKKDVGRAIQYYRLALAINPDYVEALNNLAWIGAANANAEFRNGTEAVELAQRACALTASNEPVLLGTLAAAYAESGDFANAVATATKAHDVALSKNLKSVAERNGQLGELYRAGHAYHEGEGSQSAKN